MNESETFVLVKALSDGRTAKISFADQRETDKIFIEWAVSIDGEPWTRGNLHKRVISGDRATWVVGERGRVLGLADSEAETLRTVSKARYERRRAEDPARQREELLFEVSRIGGELEEQSELAADTGEDRHFIKRASLLKDLEAATAALKEFEHAHPELRARLDAEEEQRRRRMFNRGWEG